MGAEVDALYEIGRHATGSHEIPCERDETARASGGSSGEGGGVLLYLSFQGVSKLRERWSRYNALGGSKRRKRENAASLFVSRNAEYVAVAVGNRIYILRKSDGYESPCGIYTNNNRMAFFTNGAWLEDQGIFGVVDDSNSLCLIKENGDVLTRRTSNQLKLSSTIIDLLVQDASSSQRGFYIFTTDCKVHKFDYTREPEAALYQVSIVTKDVPSTRSPQLPQSLSCVDYHQDHSLVVLVGDSTHSSSSNGCSGAYFLYVLHFDEYLELSLSFQSAPLEGVFSPPTDRKTLVPLPKVRISPQGKRIATLDLNGSVDIFVLNGNMRSVSLHPHGSGAGTHLIGVKDISWWTDNILMIVKEDGRISMYSIAEDMVVSKGDLALSTPLLEKAKAIEGYAFVLQSSRQMDSVPGDHQHTEMDKIFWSLVSFSKVTVLEMYSVLIRKNQQKEALDFASQYNLDKDDVLKACWLHSAGDIHDIQSYLVKIKDQAFVLSECVNKVGPTEAALKALFSFGFRMTDRYKFSEPDNSGDGSAWDSRIIRLRLLWYNDLLETFLGINMGRFSAGEYSKFRLTPLVDTAIALAESGKIGALNLLMKRHPYTISSDILRVLSAIPETIAVQTYSQLLPGKYPPSVVILRDGDWVECKQMAAYINTSPGQLDKRGVVKTEILLKHSTGFLWPSAAELSEWYRSRARDIDCLSGQLENCLAMIELACQKGIVELQPFFDDMKYLYQVVYSDESNEFIMNLATWEDLPDYQKFKIILKGAKDDTVVQRLDDMAIPFMNKRLHLISSSNADKQEESYLTRWMKEVATANELSICLSVIENGCGESPICGLFKDLNEMVETAICCIYVCSATNQWNTMSSILSKLLHKTKREKSLLASEEDFSLKDAKQALGTCVVSCDDMQHVCADILSRLSDNSGDSYCNDSTAYQFGNIKSLDMPEKMLKVAEGHVEVGRLFAYYQVPKPTHFFLAAHLDEKNVKQLIRLILSKFGRRQPVRSDNEWANMWRDLKLFQEKAFPFLDSEYMLAEFIRGLLKAGKFSLARNYLGGTSAVSLSTEKAENLVIQAAREYFFSASTLSCNEIWKARECLNLLPNSKNVQVETDIIDALTVRLPYLGVTILPVQFRQVKDPMEIIRMVITSQTGAYLHFEEIIDVAKLLGLRSEEEIAAVEEAIAREAVVNGDLQLAFDLCLNLTKKGHGEVWDLCAAIARGPQLDNLDTSTREKLLGFSLSHCDEESVGELLNAWKELDVHDKFEQLMVSTGTNPPNFFVDGSTYTPLPVQSVQDILDLREGVSHDREHDHVAIAKEMLSKVCMDFTNDDTYSRESTFAENRKLLSFSALELPWLLKLSNDEVHDGNKHSSETNHPIRRYRFSTKTEAINSIIYWLGVHSFAPSDDLIMFLAKSIMEPPVDEDDYVLSCSILLNLMDPFNGVKIIEEELKQRECYQEISNIMNVGMTYSSLNSLKKECSTPEQRRNLLLQKFHEKFTSIDSDDLDQIDMAHATYWGEWKSKLEEEKRMADQARMLKNVLPDIDTSRFLSGDANYIKKVVFSFVDSVKLERKHILKEAVKIAENYGLQRTEVLLRFLGCALVSEYWDNDDILNEIAEFRDDIVKSAKGVIDMIYSDVYPEIDGYNKQRLSYIFGILSACHSYLKRTSKIELTYQEHVHTHKLELFQYYKVLEEECKKVCFIDGLNYKNIAGLDNLNFDHFNEEVCKNIHASTVSALADMVQALVSMYVDLQANGLVSRQGVYKHYVLGMLASLEGRNEARSNSTDCEKLLAVLCEIELNYDSCKEYIQTLPATDISYIIGRYYTLCFPCNLARSQPQEPSWKEPLCMLITLWIKLVDDIPRQPTDASSYERTGYLDSNRLTHCMSAFRQLLINNEITVHQGWDAISMFVQVGFNSEIIMDTSHFCRAMILSGCGFKTVVEVYHGGQENLESVNADSRNPLDLLELYGASTDGCLSDLIEGSCESQALLHKLLSSLSQSVGEHADSLEMIRSGVWGKLIAFSENMQLGSQLRVYALQLMQCITGRNLKSLPNEIVSQVEPWESWYEPGASDSLADEGSTPSCSITASLVALRSNQMVTAVLPDASITPENLSSLDSAVSCFLHLSERASSVESVAVLEAVLEEWEQLFSSPKEEYVQPQDSPKEASDWSDGWDDGWEALPEELENPAQKQDGASTLSVHPLHSCWMEIIRKLAGLGELQKIIELLDRASSKHSRLLEDEEAHRLLELLSAAPNCFMALKIMLLLPYEAPQLQCLQTVEAKIREGTASTSSTADDHELLPLVLSSGALQKIAGEEGYSKLFSHTCHLVGQLARSFQSDLCAHWEAESKMNQKSLLFAKVLLPCFISELVLKGQYLLAGFIVSRWMHTPASLGLVDVVEPGLRRYLEGQVAQAQAQQQVGESDASFAEDELSISRTMSSLRLKFVSLLQAALVALPSQEP
ncbi:MAG2-interacting protein 2 [Aegilops tauschii subsp. strangulata]|uniref:Sec39 domain-containing protein n=12 Tax=Aegilops tauschii subsp. strangulata TaxID=200361 RepID=A0A453PQY9_AEGTS|nr:MAG2-interacting protein 2 [Aegilops tauschii subsp. strangulata]